MTTKWFFTGKYDEDEGVLLRHTPNGHLYMQWRGDDDNMIFPEEEIIVMRNWLNCILDEKEV